MSTLPPGDMETTRFMYSASDAKKELNVTVDDVTDLLSEVDLETENKPGFFKSDIPAGPPVLNRTCQIVKDYLLEHSAEFVRVSELRNRGWYENKAEGDAHFKRQRERADNADEATRKTFHDLMLNIADEMERVTGALSIQGDGHHEIRVLDICMAPGGYTIAALKYNPKAKVHAITLPEDQGGHPIIIERKLLQGLQLLDVTLLHNEFCDRPLPLNHPDRGAFIDVRPFHFYKFALVFCDGMVLRTHDRPSYRQELEITRLACSQLILAMQRVQHGGTIIMLLHKADSWPSALLLYTFNKFSNVQIFKPTRAHAFRSSFYMVARDINIHHEDAKVAILEWKRVWYKTTFGGPDGLGIKDEVDDQLVFKVLDEFGEQLASLGVIAWKIQADALSRTKFAGNGSGPPLRTERVEWKERGSIGEAAKPKFEWKRRESQPSGDSMGMENIRKRRESVSSGSGSVKGTGYSSKPMPAWKERNEVITSLSSWRDKGDTGAGAGDKKAEYEDTWR